MTRMKFVVAFIFVLTAYRQLNDTEFILQSYIVSHHTTRRRRWNATLAAGQRRQQPRPVVYRMKFTKNKTNSGSYDIGQFCPYCTYEMGHLGVSCNERVVEKSGQYKPRFDTEALQSSRMNREKDPYAEEKLDLRCRTPPILHIEYAERDEPSVILHAGPHKTGTTALQTFIYDLIYNNGTAIFAKDNLRIPSYDELPGVFAKEGVGLNLPHCSLRNYRLDGGNMHRGMCDRMREAFPLFVQDAFNGRENLLIAAEDFDRIDDIDFKRMRFWLQPYKRIKVLVTYRRLHDWLPSWYNQNVEHYSVIYAKGELRYPSFVEWLDANYENFLTAHSVHIADRFSSYDIVDSVDILNMHDIPNMIEHLFCNHLEARATCQAIKDGAKSTKSNIGKSHEYERIAISASLAGKISGDTLHKAVRLDRAARRIKEKFDEINALDTLPRICPKKELLDRILEMEMEHERKLFPEWYESQGGDEGLRQSFEAAVRKKFCSFDVVKILQSSQLDSFFKWIEV